MTRWGKQDTIERVCQNFGHHYGPGFVNVKRPLKYMQSSKYANTQN